MLVSSPASGHVEIDQILDSMSTSVEPSLENATPVLNLRDHPDIIQPLSHLPHSTPPHNASFNNAILLPCKLHR